MAKNVYSFGNGNAEGKADMRNLLGGKGANLAEMNLIGVPVPPGIQLQQMYVIILPLMVLKKQGSLLKKKLYRL